MPDFEVVYEGNDVAVAVAHPEQVTAGDPGEAVRIFNEGIGATLGEYGRERYRVEDLSTGGVTELEVVPGSELRVVTTTAEEETDGPA